jgi:beta-lactamase regulating signal transducer with metallopeptidase domain
MNIWFNVASRFPAALSVLVGLTVLLLVGLMMQHLLRRSAAVRHTVLLWTLIAAGLTPIMTIAVQLAAIPTPPPVWTSVQRFNAVFHTSESLGAVNSLQATHRVSFREMFLALWIAGTLVSLLKIMRELLLAKRTVRGAKPVPTERIAGARPLLLRIFGPVLPPIFTSDRVNVPMAVGYLRPIILIPSSLMDQIEDQQLSQILIHECAHALRRDALVAFYQHILTAIFWFHPLVHIASRLLDRVREEICDNYVLQSVPAKDYARTLLTVAETLSPQSHKWFAPALIQSANLESRIAGLLNSRRCIMTKMTSKKVAAIAMCFVGSVIVLSCFAGAPAVQQDSNDFSHVVNLAKTSTGDLITIAEVRGPSDTITVGNTYEVRGTYRLVSQDKAMLAVNVTTDARQPHQPHPNLPEQKMIVEKGEGSFTLQFHMWHEGMPHVTFYPIKGGEGFATRHFY